VTETRSYSGGTYRGTSCHRRDEPSRC